MMIEKVNKVVIILHIVQDDFCLEVNRECFCLVSTQQLDVPWKKVTVRGVSGSNPTSLSSWSWFRPHKVARTWTDLQTQFTLEYG